MFESLICFFRGHKIEILYVKDDVWDVAACIRCFNVWNIEYNPKDENKQMNLKCSSCHRLKDESEFDYFDLILPLCKDCNRNKYQDFLKYHHPLKYFKNNKDLKFKWIIKMRHDKPIYIVKQIYP